MALLLLSISSDSLLLSNITRTLVFSIFSPSIHLHQSYRYLFFFSSLLSLISILSSCFCLLSPLLLIPSSFLHPLLPSSFSLSLSFSSSFSLLHFPFFHPPPLHSSLRLSPLLPLSPSSSTLLLFTLLFSLSSPSLSSSSLSSSSLYSSLSLSSSSLFSLPSLSFPRHTAW